MIDQDSLDVAVTSVAAIMDPKRPMHLLRRWLNYFPPAVYPYIIAEYRRLTGQPTFVVREDGGWSATAHELMRRLR